MKVDLEHAKRLEAKSKQLMDEYLRVRGEIVALGMFCDECGETKPEGGFYPLGILGPKSISGFVCNNCRRKDERYSG